MTDCTEYVLGFAFGAQPAHGPNTSVALIRKARPDWQAGKLNGIGGHIELSDCGPQHAMQREFEEETGYTVAGWTPFLRMVGSGWRVHCFYTTSVPLNLLRTVTDEVVEIHRVRDVALYVSRLKLLPNIPWLVALARDETAHNYQIEG